MAQQQAWVSQAIETSAPSMARVYDFLLGGAHNFPADRAMAEQIEQAMPGLRHAARINRAFLGRVVRFMTSQGIRQFLDLGSGIPTVGNVHEIAQRHAPECRVVYVDRDPIAVTHSKLMLADNDHATIVHADIRAPEDILASPETRRLIDFSKPVGLLMLLVLHWIPDDTDLMDLLQRYTSPLTAGSYLAITHVSGDYQGEELTVATNAIQRSQSPDQVHLRTHAEILRLFGDFTVIDPGLVGCAMWRATGPGDISDNPNVNTLVYAGVGQKPAKA
jgi:hypothetical protein